MIQSSGANITVQSSRKAGIKLVPTARRWWVLLGIIILVSAFLRFYQLGVESLWLDEAESIIESGFSITAMAAHSNQPPLYFLILHEWINIFGSSELAIRSLSAIIGTSAVAAIFLIGKSLLSGRIGLIASFLASFSAFQISYSQEARGYILLMLLSIVSFFFFIQTLRSKSIFYPIANLIVTLLTAYTHFYAWFIISAQIILLLIFWTEYWAQKIKYTLVFFALFCLLIPQILLLKNNILSISGEGFWIPEPSFMAIVETLAAFSGSGPGLPVLLGIFAGLSIWGLLVFKPENIMSAEKNTSSILAKFGSRFKLETSQESILLLLWLFVPILLAFVISRVNTPIYWDRYLIEASPALILLVAKGLGRIGQPFICYPIIAAIVVLSSIGLYQYFVEDTKEQWREVAAFVESNSEDNDILVFNFDHGKDPFNYYYRGTLPELVVDLNTDNLNSFLESPGNLEGQKRYWLFISQFDQPADVLASLKASLGPEAILIQKPYYHIYVILVDPHN